MPYDYLSFLPILSLILIALIKDVKWSVGMTLILTILLFFYWDAGWEAMIASLTAALFSSVQILMIVFGAVLLYQSMQQTGYINEISLSLSTLHPSGQVRFFLPLLGLTAFFEGVAGFGTPGAIIPLLLISAGANPVMSVSCVLLANGLFAVFGAIGTPMEAGLVTPLGLDTASVKTIALNAALLISVGGIPVMLFIAFYYKRMNKKDGWPVKAFLFYMMIMIPMIIFSTLVTELATVLAAAIMLLTSVLIFKSRNTDLSVHHWLPYLLLIFLLLLPRIFPPLLAFIRTEFALNDILSTGITASFRPLASPLFPFIGATLLVMAVKKEWKISFKPVFVKILGVFIVLFPAVAIAQLMLNSGINRTGMIETIAEILGQTGPGYVVLAPFIGMLGAFISGSTTVSNLIFGASQAATAVNTGIEVNMILSLQHTGASLGNAVSLFNIIAAASIAGISDYKTILKNNLLPTLAGCFLAGLAAYWLLVAGY